MHFNIYLDEETSKRLQQATENSPDSRNAIIRKAIANWLDQTHKKQWPAEILAFKGGSDIPAFEANREDLEKVSEDPFA